MKKALIDPNGNFVEIANSEFPVAAPFRWVNVADDVTPQTHVWNGSAVVAKVKTLQEAQAEKLAALETSRKYFENLRYGGNNNGTSFEITKPDIIQELIIGWIAIKDNPVGTFTVRDDHGVEVTFTSTNLNLVMPMITGAKKQAIDKYWQRKAAIENAPNETALNAIETDLSR